MSQEINFEAVALGYYNTFLLRVRVQRISPAVMTMKVTNESKETKGCLAPGKHAYISFRMDAIFGKSDPTQEVLNGIQAKVFGPITEEGE